MTTFNNVKSVIIDIANNYGQSYLGIRSIDFYSSSSKHTIASGDITCYATSTLAGGYDPEYSFITALSKTGAWSTKQWLSNNEPKKQRLIVVFDTAKTIDEIRINNAHSSGGITIAGVMDVGIIFSTDTITDTVFDNSVSNGIGVFSGVFDEHIASDVEDEQTIIPVEATEGSIKSVIFDIADNYGESYMGIRAIDFYADSAKHHIDAINCTCYATSELGTQYVPEYSFIISKSKVGAHGTTQWLSNYAATNQRLIIVFDTKIDIDEIRINNAHSSGGITTAGAENVVINTSTDAITDTTYDAAIANSTEIFEGVFDEHIASDVEDEQVITWGLDLLPIYGSKKRITNHTNLRR